MSAWSANAWFATAWYSGAWLRVAAVAATTAGGGRKERIRHSRAMVYAPFDVERKKHQQEINQVQKALQEKAERIAEAEQLEIDEARRKALQALRLSQSVDRVSITSDRLIKAISVDGSKLAMAKALKAQQTEQALLAILLAVETYEA